MLHTMMQVLVSEGEIDDACGTCLQFTKCNIKRTSSALKRLCSLYNPHLHLHPETTSIPLAGLESRWIFSLLTLSNRSSSNLISQSHSQCIFVSYLRSPLFCSSARIACRSMLDLSLGLEAPELTCHRPQETDTTPTITATGMTGPPTGGFPGHHGKEEYVCVASLF